MKIEHNYQTKIDLKVVIMVSWFIVWLNKWQRNYDVELIKSKYVITTFWIIWDEVRSGYKERNEVGTDINVGLWEKK